MFQRTVQGCWRPIPFTSFPFTSPTVRHRVPSGSERAIHKTSLVVYWSESLTTNHEVPGSIPCSTVGIFPEGEDSRGDHGLGRLVEFRFKGPLLALHPPISPLTSSGQRNRASWASQAQKSVTLLPCPGGRTTKSTRACGGGTGQKKTLLHISVHCAQVPLLCNTFTENTCVCTVLGHLTVMRKWKWLFVICLGMLKPRVYRKSIFKLRPTYRRGPR